MTDFPEGVTICLEDDERDVYALFCVAHAENGEGEIDHDEVRATIHRAATRQAGIIAIIRGPERIEAALGLRAEKLWYTRDAPENWFWADLLFYVHPLHRKTRHMRELFRFAKWWGEETKMRVALGVQAKERQEEKELVFGRHGRRVAAIFLVTEGARAS